MELKKFATSPSMDVLKDIFGMPLFPHLYMIPLVFILGMFVGYNMRGTLDEEDESNPPRPKVD